MSTFKEITCEGNIDYKTLTKEGETYPKIVWENAYYMLSNQSIPIDLQSYPNGIQLQWSRYDKDTSTANNFGYSVFTYTKEIIKSGGGFVVPLFGQTGTVAGLKYIYIDDHSIRGHSQNDDEMPGTVFGVLTNHNWVLRRVIAF